jgi:hypothetical protein
MRNNMSIEAMKLALEAIHALTHGRIFTAATAGHYGAIKANLRTAIEQAEKQEPVANIRTWHKNGEQHAELWNWDKGIEGLPDGEHNLYNTPPAAQRQWVGLTDDEYKELHLQMGPVYYYQDSGHAIEAKLKEKNT